MDEVIVPPAEELACSVWETTDACHIATTSAENVDMESHHGRDECLLVLRYNSRLC